MKQKRDIVFVTFDAPRPDYPSMPYGIACLIAAITKEGYVASHLQINTHAIQAERSNISEYVGPVRSKKIQEYNKDIRTLVQNQIDENIEWLKKFRFVAFTYTRWSKEYCELAAEVLWNSGYVSDDLTKKGGQIVFGGYEITAYKKEKLADLQMAHIFIKGYAERAYVDLLRGCEGRSLKIKRKKKGIDQYVYDGKIKDEDIVSPYLTKVLNPVTRKVYWETKRGCPYNCGFCEWGAQKKNDRNRIVYFRLEDRLKPELDLFRKSGVEEINILDGTFPILQEMKRHLDILKEIFDTTDIKVVCQARFEALKDEFISLCAEYKERIHLEFGLQTIHEEEAKEIGRKNNLGLIEKWLKELQDKGISYEVSLIYSIPGQTINTFIDSIEYLLSFGCKKIRAFPLQIAANSELAEQDNEKYKQGRRNKDEMTLSVVESSSFSKEESKDMDELAQRLCSDNPYDKFSLSGKIEFSCKEKKKTGKFQYQLLSEDISFISDEETRRLVYLINRYFGDRHSLDENKKIDYDFTKPNCSIRDLKQRIKDYISRGHNVDNCTAHCEIVCGQSGNFYVISKRKEKEKE